MSTRAATDPPKGALGWLAEVVVLVLAVTFVAAIAGVLWAMRMRSFHVVIEDADCGQVVFYDDGQRWRYAPAADECKDFVMGARWTIEVNSFGIVRPRRRE
jgi:hypothetical protein